MCGVETEGCADAIFEHLGKGLFCPGFNGKGEGLERCVRCNGCRVWQCHRKTPGESRDEGLSVADFVDDAGVGCVLVSLQSTSSHAKIIQSREMPAI
jgi:hypothetical protein